MANENNELLCPKGYDFWQKQNCQATSENCPYLEKCFRKRLEEWEESLKKPISLDFVIEVLSSVIKFDHDIAKTVFLGMLLAYTEKDQLNIIQSAEPSTGKSWIVLRVADLFPKEDVIKLGYSSPTSFFHEQGIWNKEEGIIEVDLERKIVIWLDMPHPLVLERLRPLLSHDEKLIKYKITDKSEKRGLRTKTVEVKGFFSTIFCSSNAILDQQEITRSILLSPSDDPEKIKEVLKMQAQCEKNPAEFITKLDSDPKRKWLKERIKHIRDLEIRYIKVPFADELCNEYLKIHPNLKPRDQRDFPRLISLVRAIALLNAKSRNMDSNHDIEATWEDALEAMKIYNGIAESNELGLPPETYNFYRIIAPILPLKPTKKEIAKKYYEVKKRQISNKRLDRELSILVNAGLIVENSESKPYTYEEGCFPLGVGYKLDIINDQNAPITGSLGKYNDIPHPPGEKCLEDSNGEELFIKLGWKVGELKSNLEIKRAFNTLNECLEWGFRMLEAGYIERSTENGSEIFFKRLK
ncbi:MAG: hypothetical protein QW589_01420 [Candidatus Bathyarchaeia archaeon]